MCHIAPAASSCGTIFTIPNCAACVCVCVYVFVFVYLQAAQRFDDLEQLLNTVPVAGSVGEGFTPLMFAVQLGKIECTKVGQGVVY